MAESISLEGYRKDIVDVFDSKFNKLSSVLEGSLRTRNIIGDYPRTSCIMDSNCVIHNYLNCHQVIIITITYKMIACQ